MQMGVLSKCAAGGRDHTPCCQRRGVPTKCLSLCRGIVPQPAVNCLPYGGNIIQCFEEGKPVNSFLFYWQELDLIQHCLLL